MEPTVTLARRFWAAIEPIHAVVYFTPGPMEAARKTGLRGFWMSYFASRVAPLEVKPDRLAERIDDALSEQDPRRALLGMTDLQLDAVLLAPDGPNVDRARRWLAPAAELLRN